MKLSRKNLLPAFAALIIIACNNNADRSTTEDTTKVDNTRVETTDTASRASADSRWVSEVLESNYGEIRLAQQAQQKATNAEVKSVAKMLETDHNSLVNKMKELASKKGWTVATEETQDARKKFEDWNDDTDVAKYQRDWLEWMEDSHERGIRKFENANPDDPDLRAFVNETLPKLRQHHDKIMEVQKKVK